MELEHCATCNAEIYRNEDDLDRECIRCYVDRTGFVGGAVIWKCAGSTRGYGSSQNAPSWKYGNAGHEPPTVGSMGLNDADCATLGI